MLDLKNMSFSAEALIMIESDISFLIENLTANQLSTKNSDFLIIKYSSQIKLKSIIFTRFNGENSS
jgi:hypothetical protein